MKITQVKIVAGLVLLLLCGSGFAMTTVQWSSGRPLLALKAKASRLFGLKFVGLASKPVSPMYNNAGNAESLVSDVMFLRKNTEYDSYVNYRPSRSAYVIATGQSIFNTWYPYWDWVAANNARLKDFGEIMLIESADTNGVTVLRYRVSDILGTATELFW